jgi:hypothetical protein
VPPTIGDEFLIRVETEVYDLAAGYGGEQTHRLLEKIEQLALSVERWLQPTTARSDSRPVWASLSR